MSNLENLRALMVQKGLVADSLRKAASREIIPFGNIIFDGGAEDETDGISCLISCQKCDAGCESGCQHSCTNGSSTPA